MEKMPLDKQRDESAGITGPATTMDELLTELYGARLEEFVATRNRLSRAAADAGDDEAAAEIRSLRKPSISVWAANQLVRRYPEDVRALASSGEKLVESADGGDADAVRSASADRRRWVARLVERAEQVLVDAGRSPSAGHLERIGGTLYNAAVDDAGRAALLGGRLTSDVDADQLGTLGAMTGLQVAGPARPAGARRAAELEDLQSKAEQAEREAGRLERIAARAAAEAERTRDAARAAREAADRARDRFERKLADQR